jgi:aspartate-semialdehyde dehydrogenase
MLRIGFVGWRGMVGSVLMGRMREAEDFKGFEPIFFTTSNVGGEAPDTGLDAPPLKDAYDVESLSSLDIDRHLSGWGLHPEGISRTHENRMEGVLDRLGFDPQTR